MEKTLTGVVRTWKLLGHKRRFGEVMLTYGEAKELFKPSPYDALQGEGEQREINKGHLQRLKRAMEEGTYTPTPGSVGLRAKHRKGLTYTDGGRQFNLPVNSDNPLALTDAGHRLKAIECIVGDLEEKLKTAKDDEGRARHQAHLEEALSLPITFTIYLDGKPQEDFVNLQAGRAADSSHIFSLQVQQKAFDDPAFELAIAVARRLHTEERSPFTNLIRFDGRTGLPLPIKTLCARGPSDLSTSLVGLARVGVKANLDTDGLTALVLGCYKAMKEKRPELLESGKVLTPLSDGGNKGSATMLVGVATVAAYVAGVRGVGHTDERLYEDVVTAASRALDRQSGGDFSGQVKRALAGAFAKELTDASGINSSVALHDGIPVDLLKTLTPSAFAATPLPKDCNPTRRAKKAPESELAAAG